MSLKNTSTRYGLVSVMLHWIIALTVIGQFSVGWYMVQLNYYSPLYQVLPAVHKSIGILFACALVFRIIWSACSTKPAPAEGISRWNHIAAKSAQHLMNILLLIIVLLGYLISTAEGDPIDVFGWFEVPATITSIKNQEDVAGFWHYWVAVGLMTLAGIHALAALKHHYFDKDATLVRMLGRDHRSH
ncbi:MAG: cytochrome b [Pseudomonadota bacterium]